MAGNKENHFRLRFSPWTNSSQNPRPFEFQPWDKIFVGLSGWNPATNKSSPDAPNSNWIGDLAPFSGVYKKNEVLYNFKIIEKSTWKYSKFKMTLINLVKSSSYALWVGSMSGQGPKRPEVA